MIDPAKKCSIRQYTGFPGKSTDSLPNRQIYWRTHGLLVGFRRRAAVFYKRRARLYSSAILYTYISGVHAEIGSENDLLIVCIPLPFI
jgi:hypothetical protein